MVIPAVSVYACRLLRRLLGPADWWVPPPAGFLVDRPAPPPRVSCAKATAALRKCMEGKDVLAKHLVAMDDGIREDEWQGWDPYMQAKRAAGYRWWTGMKNCEEEYY